MVNGYLITQLGMIVDDPSPFLRFVWEVLSQITFV